MSDCHDRPMEEHSGAGKTHYGADLFSHIRFIAMHLAVGTKGFCLHVRAVVASGPGVSIQCSTLRAQFLAAMILAAVNGNHQGNGFFFTFPFGQCIHLRILRCFRNKQSSAEQLFLFCRNFKYTAMFFRFQAIYLIIYNFLIIGNFSVFDGMMPVRCSNWFEGIAS